ncbi:hypothetical protein [Alicyclobacillus fastidiosus]|uniref:Uncharacterized protein n=1 Tax=Alicyclobacillus fastidiosus TaxID=392011 RepID=A0ABV5AIC4_9BACL|nr:hypothetical protein [Alicyclobacillus fastidiosus]WEH11139.1 hypothetical protein PYS47_07950 [Alicyclobacillus fastidiosus]
MLKWYEKEARDAMIAEFNVFDLPSYEEVIEAGLAHCWTRDEWENGRARRAEEVA